MTYAYNLWIFSVLLFGIIIVPGMDMFFVIANALTGGRARGLSATAGVMLGGVFHTVFAAVCVGVLTTLPALRLHHNFVGGCRLYGVDWLDAGAEFHHGIKLGAKRFIVDATGLRPRLCHLRAEPQSLYVHAGGLPAIYAGQVWFDVGASLGDGADHDHHSGCSLWRAGIGGGKVAGFPDGLSRGDHMDRARCGGGVFGGGGVDGGEGRDGVNVFYCVHTRKYAIEYFLKCSRLYT